MYRFLSILFLIVIMPLSTGVIYAKPLDVIPKNISIAKLRSDYLKFLKKYNTKMCHRSDREKFESLLDKYRASDFYVPYLKNGNIDLYAIRKNLPLIEKKLKWIRTQRTNLPKGREFKKYRKLSQQLLNQVHKILDYKKQQLLKNDFSRKSFTPMAQLVLGLKNEYMILLKNVSYLSNFSYPVDHLSNRVQYDQEKHLDKSRSNFIYFKRKIYEDGAYDPNHTKPDIYLRTTLDSIGLFFSKDPTILPESIRYDLKWTVRQIRGLLSRGRSQQLKRLKEWELRTAAALEFYQSILHKYSKAKLKTMAQAKSKSIRNLKGYVYLKQAQSFEYLAQQKPAMRALFVMDQILLNEVGLATSVNYRERSDVAQVVINRFQQANKYFIPSYENIYRKLKNNTKFKSATTHNYKWLNVLYKESEFSFTYYYMPGSVFIHCPDFYKTARITRNKNIALAIYALRNPDNKFKALRYYSRESMLGRISAEKLWPNYKKIPERPGKQIKNIKHLSKFIKKGTFTYFYSFKSLNDKLFNVFEINGDPYSVHGFPNQLEIYHYRNPHKFTFFKPR